MVDRNGTPLGLTLSGANRHDSMMLAATLDAVPSVRHGRGRPRRRPVKLHADKAYDRVAAVRDAVGDMIELMIDGHGRFEVATAIAVARELAVFRPCWFEEPVSPEDIAALPRCAAAATSR